MENFKPKITIFSARKIIILWALFFIVAFIFQWNHHLSSDEGIVLTAAWRMILGEIPYRDFFAIEAPGIFLVLAGAFKIFGAHYIVAKIVSLLFFFFSCVGLYKITKKFLHKDFFVFSCLYSWLLLTLVYVLINHNTFSIFFFIWAVYFFLESQQNGIVKYYFFSGLFGGISALFLQTKGLSYIGFVLCFLLLFDRKNIKKYFLLGVGYIVPFGILLFFPLKELWFHMFVFPYQNYLPYNQLNLRYFIAFLFLHVLFGFAFFRQKASKENWLLLFASFFLSLSSYTRPDIQHILLNAVFIPILIFCTLELPVQKKSIFSSATFQKFAVIVFFVPLFGSLLLERYPKHNISSFIKLENPALKQIVEYVKTESGNDDFIYAGPFLPGLYFETQRRVPSRFHYMIPGYIPQSYLLDMVSDLQKKMPTLILLGYDNVVQYNYPKDNVVDNFIQQNYEEKENLFGITILKRKELISPGAE